MSNEVALLLVAGLIVAVVLALIMNRKFKASWGNKGVQTGGDEASKGQNMTATGRGSSIKGAVQIRNQTFGDEQNMRAEGGGKLENVGQRIGPKED